MGPEIDSKLNTPTTTPQLEHTNEPNDSYTVFLMILEIRYFQLKYTKVLLYITVHAQLLNLNPAVIFWTSIVV